MGQNDELKQAWQKQLEGSRNGVSDFWRANAAYWQTVSDIMGHRAATATSWWQNLPQHMQGFAQAKSWPEFAEAFTKWQQQTWLSAWHLGVDTHQQRNYLWEEWQKLAQRNGVGPAPEKEKSAAPSSFYAARPHLQPQAPAAKPAAAPKAATPQPAPQPTPAKAAEPEKAPEPIMTAAAAPVTNDLGGEAVQPQPPAQPARNAAQAATFAAATSARRSVVASHRSRASRRTTH